MRPNASKHWEHMAGLCCICRSILGSNHLCVNCLEVSVPNPKLERAFLKAAPRRFNDSVLTGFGSLGEEIAAVERDERFTVERHVDERQQEQWA